MIAAPQGSPEWLQARCGKVTASRFSDVLAKGRGLVRDKYLRQLVSERLTGKPSESAAYGGWAQNLDRGHVQEPVGRRAYEIHTGNIVQEVGFIDHPRVPMVGCSPDGLIDEDGGLELKSALPHVHVEVMLRGDSLPPEHKPQVQGCMWGTDRKWWDVGSFCEHMPEHLRIYIFRVERDEAYIEMLSVEVSKFNREVEQMYASLMERKG